MLQWKPGIHRQHNAENSEMKITNPHILMRDCGIAHVRVRMLDRIAIPGAFEALARAAGPLRRTFDRKNENGPQRPERHF
jgi:hypothetical protein